MRKTTISLAATAAFGLVAAMGMQPASAQSASQSNMNSSSQMNSNNQKIQCKMEFKLAGWSAIYKTASGAGTIHCKNGETRKVKLSAKGGGLTAGKYKITDGHASFTGVEKVSDIMGSYATASAHAGATKTVKGTVMTKGNVTMSMGGTGNGWDLGVGLGSFTIKLASGSDSSM